SRAHEHRRAQAPRRRGLARARPPRRPRDAGERVQDVRAARRVPCDERPAQVPAPSGRAQASRRDHDRRAHRGGLAVVRRARARPFEVWERDAQGVLIRQNALALRNWGARLGSNIDGMGMPDETVNLWREINARVMSGEVVSWPIDYVVGGKPVNYINMVAPVR